MLARVFGNSADFWMNVQRRNDLCEPCIRRSAGSVSSAPGLCARLPHDGPSSAT